MKMNFVDFQKYIGTLATKYSDFDFNVRIYDSEQPDGDGRSAETYVDYNGKGSNHTTFTEKRKGSLMIESHGFSEFTKKNPSKDDDEGDPNFLDNILAKIQSKVANLGLQQYDNIQYDCGPYVWFTIIFAAEGRDVISDFPLDRLDEFVEVVNSVLEPYQPFEG